MITKKIIAENLLAYLQNRLSLADLVAWAEDTLSQLGLADVKAFGLEWKDCERIMERLGYQLEVKALQVA